ncbi:MAG: 4Fe-4S binding protein [Candidatus Syntropharchaeia archaeon]
MISVDEERCNGCAWCVPSCEQDAIRVWVVAEIEKEECTDCMECIFMCPAGALSEV